MSYFFFINSFEINLMSHPVHLVSVQVKELCVFTELYNHNHNLTVRTRNFTPKGAANRYSTFGDEAAFLDTS